ncbi:hypothetical protein D6856_08170 [Butyrivibrio sp. XB500-5]|nr:hypothetical protein D6856_08170 [Butyrivibrio sp. XB500-5]
MILDLRKCVGGDFDDCVRSCNLFLSNCEIVSVQNKRCKLSVTAYNWKVNSKSVDSLTDYTKRCDDHGIWKHILNEIN